MDFNFLSLTCERKGNTESHTLTYTCSGHCLHRIVLSVGQDEILRQRISIRFFSYSNFLPLFFLCTLEELLLFVFACL